MISVGGLLGEKRPFFGAAALLFCAVGCGPECMVHDAQSLSAVRRVAVMPVARPDGVSAGYSQAGVLLTELAAMDAFGVEGPGQFRRALRQAGKEGDEKLQADIARKLGIDALGVCEVSESRWTTRYRSASYYFGTAVWSERTYHLSVQVTLMTPDGRLLYTGRAAAESKEGFAPATGEATRQALIPLAEFLAKVKRERKEAAQ
jgi:hypothetical protein